MSRPKITLKLATSLDGKIALGNGNSKWITGEKARQKGRELRAIHDAIAIGSNTALADDPLLTTRITGKKDPIRVVYDSSLRLPVDSQLVRTAKNVPVWVFANNVVNNRVKLLEDNNILVFQTNDNLRVNIGQSLSIMSDQGVSTLLVEGGGTLAASFLTAGLVDEIHWFRAPIILGGDGRNGIAEMGLETLDAAINFKRRSIDVIDTDTYEIFEKPE